MAEIHNPKSRPEQPQPNRLAAPTAFEEPPGSCHWEPFKRGPIDGIRRVEIQQENAMAKPKPKPRPKPRPGC